MKDSDLPALKEAAQQWVHDNEDSIEVFDCYVSFDRIPEEIKEGSENWIEDAKDWAEGAGADSRIGFVIQKITAENGATGFAFIEVVGSSWEGLRIFVEDIFATERDARRWVEEIGLVI